MRLLTSPEALDSFSAEGTDVVVVAAGESEAAVARAEEALSRMGATLLTEEPPARSIDRAYARPAGGGLGALVLAGSAKPAARAQVDALADDGALVLTLTRQAVLDQDETFLMGLRSGAAAAIKQGRNVVVRSENWPEAVEMTRRLAAKRWISADEVERRVRTMLARVAEGVVHAVGHAGVLRQVIAVGTETSAAVCEQLQIGELRLLYEVCPDLPIMLAQTAQPLYVVLKSGASGEPDALRRAIALEN